MTKPIQKVWTFLSDSNPDVEYQTLQYADGSTSCNCAGWTRRVASDGSRSCKHTRWVDLGTADQHCSASRDYGTAKPQNHYVEKQIETPGQRKFHHGDFPFQFRWQNHSAASDDDWLLLLAEEKSR